MQLIWNGTVLAPDGSLPSGCVLVDGSRIRAVLPRPPESFDGIRLDAGGGMISPGWIDLHVHGGGGHDVMDATPDALRAIARTHVRHGTTALLPTTVAGSARRLRQVGEAFRDARHGNPDGARLLGLHLEGPYLSRAQRGAQDPAFLRNPDPDESLALLQDCPGIVRWSAAPELPGALAFGRELASRGILPSIAHSDAFHEDILAAVEAGFRHVTHLYSGTSGVRRIDGRRRGGVIEAALLLDALTVEIIADGHHLPPELLQLVRKVKGPDRTALVTDAIRAAGLPEGPSVLGDLEEGQPIVVDGGVAWLPDRSAFAGSVATMDRVLSVMVRATGCRCPKRSAWPAKRRPGSWAWSGRPDP